MDSSFKEPGVKLVAKKCFQRQSWTKHLSQTLDLM